jgi:hypothetical protein
VAGQTSSIRSPAKKRSYAAAGGTRAVYHPT